MAKSNLRITALLLCCAAAIIVFLNFKGGDPGAVDTKPVDKANAQEIYEILSESPDTIVGQIKLERIEVSMPTDGHEPRVLVRVDKGMAGEVPEKLIILHNSRKIEVPLEAEETYEEYHAQ